MARAGFKKMTHRKADEVLCLVGTPEAVVATLHKLGLTQGVTAAPAIQHYDMTGQDGREYEEEFFPAHGCTARTLTPMAAAAVAAQAWTPLPPVPAWPACFNPEDENQDGVVGGQAGHAHGQGVAGLTGHNEDATQAEATDEPDAADTKQYNPHSSDGDDHTGHAHDHDVDDPAGHEAEQDEYLAAQAGSVGQEDKLPSDVDGTISSGSNDYPGNEKNDYPEVEAGSAGHEGKFPSENDGTSNNGENDYDGMQQDEHSTAKAGSVCHEDMLPDDSSSADDTGSSGSKGKNHHADPDAEVNASLGILQEYRDKLPAADFDYLTRTIMASGSDTDPWKCCGFSIKPQPGKKCQGCGTRRGKARHGSRALSGVASQLQ